jgi:hypothetical protein
LQTIEKNRVQYLQKIINIISNYYTGVNDLHVIERPNTNFTLNTATESLALYLEAKEKKSPSYILDKLYIQYLETEFRNDILMYDRYLKLMLLNPAPHHEINEVAALLNPMQLAIKINFERYVNQFENETNTKIENPDNTVEKINSYFIKYYNNESISN